MKHYSTLKPQYLQELTQYQLRILFYTSKDILLVPSDSRRKQTRDEHGPNTQKEEIGI